MTLLAAQPALHARPVKHMRHTLVISKTAPGLNVTRRVGHALGFVRELAKESAWSTAVSLHVTGKPHEAIATALHFEVSGAELYRNSGRLQLHSFEGSKIGTEQAHIVAGPRLSLIRAYRNDLPMFGDLVRVLEGVGVRGKFQNKKGHDYLELTLPGVRGTDSVVFFASSFEEGRAPNVAFNDGNGKRIFENEADTGSVEYEIAPANAGDVIRVDAFLDEY